MIRYFTTDAEGNVLSRHHTYPAAVSAARRLSGRVKDAEEMTCHACGEVVSKIGARLHAGHCDKCWNKS